MITAWRKSATAPRGSLRRPSSNTCRNRSHTPGSAFSNSSSSTTENGWRRIRPTSDASVPTSSSPSIRRALPGFWYSDRSSRIIRSPDPNRYSASALAISVLPVPVGPTKSSTPSGRVGSVRPALSSATRSTTHSTASGWPITRVAKNARSSSTSSRERSSSIASGIPERSDTVASTSSTEYSSPTRRLVASSSDSTDPGSAPGRKCRASANASPATPSGATARASASVVASPAGSSRSGSNADRTAGRSRSTRS